MDLRSSPGRQGRHRRYRVDARRHRARPADDPGARPLLRGPRPLEEHAQHVHDVRRGDRDRHRDLGPGRLLARLRRRRRPHRRPRLRVPERRRRSSRATGRRSRTSLFFAFQATFCIITDGARLRRGGRADALRRVPDLRRAVVGPRLRGARPLGLRRRLADRAAARSTSPAACRSRWARASRPWPRRSWSARARTTGARRCCPTTRSTCCSAPACCGSAGSASTAAAASTPATTRACSRSPTRC